MFLSYYSQQPLPKESTHFIQQGIEVSSRCPNNSPNIPRNKTPAVLALARKKQLKLKLKNLLKEEGTELHDLIARVERTRYIKHTTNLENFTTLLILHSKPLIKILMMI